MLVVGVLGKEFVEFVIRTQGQSGQLMCGFRLLVEFLGGVTRLFGHFLGSLSYSGSFRNSWFSLDTNLSRLARCVGLSSAQAKELVNQILCEEICIKEQIYFELLYVSAFGSPVKVSKTVFPVWNLVQSLKLYYKKQFCPSLRITRLH